MTRCARRYSARPWASPLRGQRRRCSKLLPAILSGQIPRRLVICPTGCRQLSNPGRGFSSPRRVLYAKKKPVLAYELFLKYGGEGGLTRCARRYSARPWASPLRGQRKRCSKLLPAILSGQIPRRLVICPTGCRQLSNPGRGFSSPPAGCYMRKKKPVLAYELFLKYGGEGGIRTPDTLPYTHFPGVLLQPLGHLTILFCRSPWVGNGALL